MAHNAGMVRKPDILVLVVYTISFDGASGAVIIVDDEGARDIYLHSAGVGDGLLHPRHAPRTLATGIRLRAIGGSHGGT
jgi:hypothetical protein